MQIEFEFTLNDALEMGRIRRRLWLKKAGMVLIVVLVALAVLVPGLFRLVFNLSFSDGMFSAVTVGACLFALLWQSIEGTAKEAWTTATWMRGPFVGEITEDGLFIRSALVQLRLAWNVLDVCVESTNLFVVGQQHMAVGLPKRAFTESQLSEARALFARIPQASAPGKS